MKKIVIFLATFIALQANAQDFNAETTTGCVPLIVQFTATSGDAWEWDFGDGTSVAYTNPINHLYTSAGAYTVKCTIIYSDSRPQQIVTKTNYIVVNPKPHADFTSFNNQSCDPLNVEFINISYDNDTASLTYQWFFGDSLSNDDTSSLKHPEHFFNNYKYYDVSLIVTNIFNCKDTITKPDYVKIEGMSGEIFPDTLIGCKPLRVNFNFNISGFDHKDSYKDTMILFFDDGESYVTEFVGAPLKHEYRKEGFYIPLIQLISWFYNENTGKYERCIRGYIVKDTIKVLGYTVDFRIENKQQEILSDGIKMLKPNDTAYFFDESDITPKDLTLSYKWNFGNGDSITTFDKFCKYVYPDTGSSITSLEITNNICNAEKASHLLIVNESDNISEYKQLPNIEIYPNPVTSTFKIKAENTSIKYVEVVDLLGNVLLKTSNISREININHLSKGLYFIKIHTKEDIISKKIIKT
ncbi:MAG: PKD domain-containing protein [Bacteroidales bacterium]